MMIELGNIHRQVGCTFIHVTGNEQEAIAMGTRVAMLADGQIAQYDTPEAVFANPASATVARLLSCHNTLRGATSSTASGSAARADRCASSCPRPMASRT